MAILVDSNVLSDLINRDPEWYNWSAETIREAGNREILVINQLILAEVSVTLPSYEDVDKTFPVEWLVRENLPWEAAYLAGQSFLQYRRRRGVRRSPLPDFYIGAHALVRGHRLLTRDAERYRTYFPKLRLIAPD